MGYAYIGESHIGHPNESKHRWGDGVFGRARRQAPGGGATPACAASAAHRSTRITADLQTDIMSGIGIMHRGAAGVLALAVPGIAIQMACRYTLENIGEEGLPGAGIALLMREYVNSDPGERPGLDVDKLQAHLLGEGADDASERPSWSRLVEMFTAIGERDFGLSACLEEACAEDDEMECPYVKYSYDNSMRTCFSGLLGNPARRRWAVLRAAARLLAVQKRAAVSANHPSRKRDRGEFEVGDM